MVFSEKYMRVLLALALVGVIVALFAYAHSTMKSASFISDQVATITVNGEGEVLARPDIATFSFSVRAESKDAATAQEESAEAINAIVTYLKGEGIEEKDIKTQNYSLNPRYDYVRENCTAEGFCPGGKQVLRGYEVSQMVRVKVRDVDSAGPLLSGVGERGATNISSLSFTIDEEDDLLAEAREAAIDDAKGKAKELANDLGVRLVRIVGFEEGGRGGVQYLAKTNMMAFDGDMAESAMAPEIPVGENTFTSNVSITYEVR